MLVTVNATSLYVRVKRSKYVSMKLEYGDVTHFPNADLSFYTYFSVKNS